MRRLILGLILLLLALIVHFPVLAIDENTALWLEPTQIALGPDYCVGETFTLACKIKHNNIISFGLQIAWNTTYLEYVEHEAKVPVEDYPDGLLHEPIITICDLVDIGAGTYDCVYGTLGREPYDGVGTAFEITFRVKYQPLPPEADADFWIRFTLADIYPDLGPMGIYPELTEESHIIIHAYEEPSPSPPVGGTSTSIDSGKFSSWITTTLLLVAVVVTLNVKWNRRGKKH